MEDKNVQFEKVGHKQVFETYRIGVVNKHDKLELTTAKLRTYTTEGEVDSRKARSNFSRCASNNWNGSDDRGLNRLVNKTGREIRLNEHLIRVNLKFDVSESRIDEGAVTDVTLFAME